MFQVQWFAVQLWTDLSLTRYKLHMRSRRNGRRGRRKSFPSTSKKCLVYKRQNVTESYRLIHYSFHDINDRNLGLSDSSINLVECIYFAYIFTLTYRIWMGYILESWYHWSNIYHSFHKLQGLVWRVTCSWIYMYMEVVGL